MELNDRHRALGSGRPPRLAALLGLITLIASLLPSATAFADPGDIGVPGPSFVGSSGTASGSKPESKLWWNDGIWWGSLWDTTSGTYHIQRLDLARQAWVDTGVQLDNRAGTRADALWDGTKLYVASHRYSSSPASGYAARLYRFSYNAAAMTYTLDAGFPATIHNFKVETMVIDKDTTGMLWATWIQNNQVHVSHTNGSDTTWVAPYVLPVAGTTVDIDDISSVIHFQPSGQAGRIGVMWSNQVDDKVHFAIHRDGTPDNLWDASKTAIEGPGVADDHINLKSVQSDGSGKVYAAIKTGHSSSSAPLIMVLVFDPVSGSWSSSVAGRVSDSHTRPIIVVDDEHAIAHVFMTGPQPPATSGQGGGSIYTKSAPLATLAFPVGVGTPIIRDADSPDMNDATTMKQNVNSTTGLLILAGNDTTGQYWWHFDPLGGSPPQQNPPVAAFTATPTSGAAPLSVSFTDMSTNLPTSWAWDFDNNGTVDSTVRNPSFVYSAPGTYTVKLTASNTIGSDDEVKVGFVTVGQPLTFASFAPVADAFVSSSRVAKNYGSDVTLRVRNSTTVYRSYLRFTVSGLDGPVESARLRLFVTDSSPDGGSIYAVGSTWTETGISWSNAPDLPGSALTAIGATPPVGSWVDVDLGAAITGNGTLSFAIASNSTNSAYYSSRQGTNPPQLIVGYEAGGTPPVAPVAAFSASPTSGTAPLSVTFSDASTNEPTSWAWDFDNNGTVDSNAQNPVFTYTSAGTYTVKLTASNAGGSDVEVKPNFVTVDGSPTPTPTPPSSTMTVTPVADSRILQSAPNSNYGADVALRVRLDPTGAYRSYLRFTVAGITGSVGLVKLRLFCTDPAPNGGTVYPTSANWTESTLTWGNAPAATGPAIRTIPAVALNTWVEVDLTSSITADGTYNLLLSDGDTNSAFYSSREGANPPQLVVTQSP
jgi:trimeric autotransporter adhesin